MHVDAASSYEPFSEDCSNLCSSKVILTLRFSI